MSSPSFVRAEAQSSSSICPVPRLSISLKREAIESTLLCSTSRISPKASCSHPTRAVSSAHARRRLLAAPQVPHTRTHKGLPRGLKREQRQGAGLR